MHEPTRISMNGVIMSLGTLVRPRDPAEDKYAKRLSAEQVRAVNLNEAVSLVRSDFDPRHYIFYQGMMGSCASVGSCTAAIVGRNVARNKKGLATDAQPFNPAPVYYMARKMHGWEDDDTGSYIADNMDLILDDGPLLTADKPYSDNYRKIWTADAWNDGVQDYQKSHQPFYSNLLENIWLALSEGKPIVIGMYWNNEFFSPREGRLPKGVPFNPNVGGHAVYVWGYTPGWVLCANSWGSGWTSDAAKFGMHMRPGDFAIPVEYFQPKRQVFEARIVNPEPVIIEPTPEPQPPKPDPGPEPQPPKPEPIDCKEQVEVEGVRLVSIAHGIKDKYLAEAKKAKTEYAKNKARWQADGAQACINAMSMKPQAAGQARPTFSKTLRPRTKR